MALSAIACSPDDAPLATLRLHSDSLIPEDVSRLMNMAADMTAVKGGPAFRRKDGSFSEVPTGTWFVTSAGKVASPEPSVHLGWAVELVEDHAASLKDGVPDLQVEFSLLILDEYFDIKILPDTLVQRAAAFGWIYVDAENSGIHCSIPPAFQPELSAE